MSIRNVDNNRNRVNTPLVALTAIGGGVAGGYLARTYFLPGAKRAELENLNKFPQNFVKKIMDAINIDKAQEAFENKKINQKTLDFITNIKQKLSEIHEKQITFETMGKTVADKASEAYKTALKEANKAFMKMREIVVKINGNFTKEFADLKIFDKIKFEETSKYVKENALKVIKILTKPTAIGIGAGAVAGLLLGLGLNSLFGGRKSD